MQAPPAAAGPYQTYATAPSGSSSSNPSLPYAQQQQQFQQYQQPTFDQPGQPIQQQQEALQEDAADGSRGLGTGLMGAGHSVHKVGRVMHHIAHPVQALKYHTVDKVKRKIKGKLCNW
jgi:hypothetical protein